MFEDKPKPSAPADKAQANLAIKGGKPDKKQLPPLDPKVMDKLKQEAGSVRFTTVTFKKHADRVDAASFKKNSGRLCYWCVEEECLRERMRAWYKEEPDTKKGNDYASFRVKMDKRTNYKCPKYAGIKQRKEPEAEIYNADISINDSNDDSHDETVSLVEEETRTLHCHRSCVTYETPCEFPGKCKRQRKENKPCPIKRSLGEHLCGETKKISELEFNRMNRRRGSDQPLYRIGIVDDMIEYRNKGLYP